MAGGSALIGAARPAEHDAPCRAAGSVLSDYNGCSDWYDIISRYELPGSVAGAVYVRGDALARPWDALNIKISARLRELIGDRISVIRCDG